jgi:antitoxin (DNA-binding transcriptional repressor) of toxin-antitoxin stability system
VCSDQRGDNFPETGGAQAGEVVEVTSHRKPIARITAVKPADAEITSSLQKAIDAGLIS